MLKAYLACVALLFSASIFAANKSGCPKIKHSYQTAYGGWQIDVYGQFKRLKSQPYKFRRHKKYPDRVLVKAWHGKYLLGKETVRPSKDGSFEASVSSKAYGCDEYVKTDCYRQNKVRIQFKCEYDE